jgi:hypothetical protein
MQKVACFVRPEHGRKLPEVAKQDISLGGARTEIDLGGQQSVELVAMEEPPAVEFECVDFAVATQLSEQGSRQVGETRGGFDGVTKGLAGEALCPASTGLVATDGLSDSIEEEVDGVG